MRHQAENKADAISCAVCLHTFWANKPSSQRQLDRDWQAMCRATHCTNMTTESPYQVTVYFIADVLHICMFGSPIYDTGVSSEAIQAEASARLPQRMELLL